MQSHYSVLWSYDTSWFKGSACFRRGTQLKEQYETIIHICHNMSTFLRIHRNEQNAVKQHRDIYDRKHGDRHIGKEGVVVIQRPGDSNIHQRNDRNKKRPVIERRCFADEISARGNGKMERHERIGWLCQ